MIGHEHYSVMPVGLKGLVGHVYTVRVGIPQEVELLRAFSFPFPEYNALLQNNGGSWDTGKKEKWTWECH